MDEVDGSSRGTSTDGSSSGSPHIIQPELHSSCSAPQLHSPWSASQREIAYSSQSRGLNVSSSGRTYVDRTDFSYVPTVASSGGNQFGSHFAIQSRGRDIPLNGRTDVGRTDFDCGPTVACSSSGHEFGSHLATKQSETTHPKSVKHNGNNNANNANNANSLTDCPAGGGGANKLPETKHNSRTDEQPEFLFREDDPSVLSGGLHSGTRQPPQLNSRISHTFELRSDLNPQYDYDKDREKNVFVPKYDDETSLLSLSEVRRPPEQIELREHLPKVDPAALRDGSAYHNAQMQGAAAYQRSMTGSFVQQCSDVNGYESYVPFEREFYEGNGNSLPREMREGYIGAGHLENVVQNQDALLRARDQELLELKEANHRQSLFIEKVLTEKRLLETAVVEQARLLMSNGPQRSNATGPVQQTVVGRGGSFDSQLYEAQLATYKEDFENERKEKLLIKGSADSLKEQLQTALNELRLAQDKLKKTEEELERYRNPYRAAYEPFLRTSSNHSNLTASSSSWSSQSAAAAAAQNKTPLYRKPDQLEQDRVNRTVVATPTKIDQLTHQTSTTGHETKVDLRDLTRSDRPCATEEPRFPSLSQLCQKTLSGAAKRPHSQEYEVNQKQLINSGRVSQIEEMNLTRQGQCDWINNSERQILLVC